VVIPVLMQTLQDAIGQCRPEWLRIPDAVRFCGLSRSSLYELIREAKLRSVCLRKRNRARGVRLISADSLSSFIEAAASGGGDQ